MRRIRTLAILSLLVALVAPAPGGAATEYSRLYLLSADTDYSYWSVDPSDPEASQLSLSRTCGSYPPYGTSAAKPCLSSIPLGGSYLHSIFFFPATLFDGPVEWSTAQPLRFHLELTVGSPLAYTVHLALQKGTAIAESPAATEVSPGVWEGVLRTGSPLEQEVFNIVGVRIRTQSPRVSLDLETAGASYVELPAPEPARSVPQLLAASPDPVDELLTAHRTLRFNDDQWSVSSFSGDLAAPQSFTVPLGSQAAIVLAWIEAYDTPIVDDVLRGRGVDARKLTDVGMIKLFHDGDEIDHGGNSEGVEGVGTDSLAVVQVPPGVLRLDVTPTSESENYPYDAHILVIHGARTLSSMRWRFMMDANEPVVPHRSPLSGSCPASHQPIPTTREVTTFSMDLDWTTSAPAFQKWTPRFAIPTVGAFPCGEAGNGDRVRLTYPIETVWYVGATPSRDALFVSERDTVFEMEVRYAYTPVV